MVLAKDHANCRSERLGIGEASRISSCVSGFVSLQAPTATFVTGAATTPSASAYTLLINVTYSTAAVQLPFSNPAAVSQGIVQVATDSSSPQVLKGTAMVSQHHDRLCPLYSQRCLTSSVMQHRTETPSCITTRCSSVATCACMPSELGQRCIHSMAPSMITLVRREFTCNDNHAHHIFPYIYEGAT